MIRRENFRIGEIPAILWGRPSRRAYVHVHGKLSRKEYAEDFAREAEEKGFQTISFDLAEHGDRLHTLPRLDAFSGVADVTAVLDYAFARYKSVSLFACSIGAYFALNACADMPIEKCLFLSPILDMAWLVGRMMDEAGVTPERLQAEGEIDTPLEPLRWDYYQYILSHPILRWPIPTAILYGGRDELQPLTAMEDFARRFRCRLSVSEDSEHPFLAPGDGEKVKAWLGDII